MGTSREKSPIRFAAAGSALLVVDMQPKLLSLIPSGRLVSANVKRLVVAAQPLGISIHATEQYPKGLGPTDPELASLLGPIAAKTAFSAAEASGIASPIRPITLVGIETHVCLMQTALDFLADEFPVQIPVDAVAARGGLDHEVALRRMENAGAIITTTEAVLFEWIGDAKHPQFKLVSNLVKDFQAPA